MSEPLAIAVAAAVAALWLVLAGRLERGALAELQALLRLLTLIAAAVVPLALAICAAAVLSSRGHGECGLGHGGSRWVAGGLYLVAGGLALRLLWPALRLFQSSRAATVRGAARDLATRIRLDGGQDALVLPVQEPLAYTVGGSDVPRSSSPEDSSSSSRVRSSTRFSLTSSRMRAAATSECSSSATSSPMPSASFRWCARRSHRSVGSSRLPRTIALWRPSAIRTSSCVRSRRQRCTRHLRRSPRSRPAPKSASGSTGSPAHAGLRDRPAPSRHSAAYSSRWLSSSRSVWRLTPGRSRPSRFSVSPRSGR